MESGQEFDLRFEKDKAYLSETKSLHFQNVVGLPDFVISFPEPATWRLRVLSHDRPSGSIYVEMVKCRKGRFDFSPEQSSDEYLDQVRKIHLNKLDRTGFLQTFDSNYEAAEYHHPEKQKSGEKTYPNYPYYRPTVRPVFDSFTIPIKKLTFREGGVTFSRKISGIQQQIEFFIPNPVLKREFNAVKNYFINVLQTRKIQVNAEVEIVEDRVTKQSATSPEIERITEDTLRRINEKLVEGIINPRGEIDSGHVLLKLEELISAVTGEETDTGIFYEEPQELLEDVIRKVETKHLNHLGYLSRKHLHNVTQLRFVLKPFSYVFLLESRLFYHLIWETHNTEEATYIWRMSKDSNEVEQHMTRVEGIISTIKANRKSDYIRSAPDGFNRVIHDYSDPVAGFKKWKTEIEEILR